MIVTNLAYGLENRLLAKLDVMIKNCEQKAPKRDAQLIIEGKEGEGKTSSACACAYYIKSKTNREIHMFFNLEPLIKFAQNNENKIIIWDEPALDALGTDWYNRIVKDMMRLLMAVRKKRHFFIFNFTKFYKFSEYIVVDRSSGLIHMYSRNGVLPGRFIYIRQKKLESLWLSYRVSHKRSYKKFKAFYGSFPEVLEKHFSKMGITLNGIKNATLEDYEKEKDKAIANIGNEKNKTNNNPHYKSLIDLRRKIGNLKMPIKTKAELASKLDYHDRNIRNWAKLPE